MGYLTLENGQYFEGKLFGRKQDSIGRIVFNTGMTEYENVVSDTLNYGLMVVLTYPLIGNYGISNHTKGTEGLRGIIVRELCDYPSNWQSEEPLSDFLTDNNIIGIQGIDTRHLTKIIAKYGSMNAMISDKCPTKNDIERLSHYKLSIPLDKISTPSKYCIKGDKHKIGIIDYGVNAGFIECLKERNLDITVLPYLTDYEDIIKAKYDGIILSDGPSDPNLLSAQVKSIKLLLGKVPILGIGMGHYLIALAKGGSISKLPYGHRGSAQPIKCQKTNKMYITSQNHSYIVDNTSIPTDAEITFINWNDYTIEGLEYNGLNCFSIQFYPELISGFRETSFLVDKFINLMENHKNDLHKS